MSFNGGSFEKRVKENIKNYKIKNLYNIDILKEYFGTLGEEYDIDILLTDRHGEKTVIIGDFSEFEPDVITEPGEKLRVHNRTVGHLYVRYDRVLANRKEKAKKMLSLLMVVLTDLGNEVYMHRESMSYMEELEKKLEVRRFQNKYGEREDILTGVFNKNYFESRMNVFDRSETVPIAVINVNINDWKFVYNNYGVEKSDSLIQLVASILMKEAKDEYIIGRIDGDAFIVLIPLPIEGEAEEYKRRVQEVCDSYGEDSVLAPSVAIGIVYKTNVEEKLKDKLSDAEYEMYDNKFEIKSSPGYQERLRRGLKES